jgi:hypothetical protein
MRAESKDAHVQRYKKKLSNSNAASASDMTPCNCGYALCALRAGTPNYVIRVFPQSSGLSAATGEVTTLQTVVAVVRERKQRRLLQSHHKGSAAERMASPRACLRQNQLHLGRFPNRIRSLAGTAFSGDSVVKAGTTSTPTPNLTDPVRRTKQQVARADCHCKAACPEIPTTSFQAY